jgi:hypothetical protein
MWPIVDLWAYLSGRWQIERTMTDRRLSTEGRMHGEARFRDSSNSLVHEERVTLSFGAHEGAAEQTYFYNFPSGNGRASVCFRDGRPFHELDLSKGKTAVVHLCPPDRYEGRFTALDEDRWESVWTVVGPRKDLTIVSSYRRT